MSKNPAELRDSRDPDDPGPPALRSIAGAEGQTPVAALSVEEFLGAFPSMAHELSEALTAISAYLSGSHRILEHGTQFAKLGGAVERAGLQAERANEALRRLRDGFARLPHPRP